MAARKILFNSNVRIKIAKGFDMLINPMIVPMVVGRPKCGVVGPRRHNGIGGIGQ